MRSYNLTFAAKYSADHDIWHIYFSKQFQSESINELNESFRKRWSLKAWKSTVCYVFLKCESQEQKVFQFGVSKFNNSYFQIRDKYKDLLVMAFIW